MIHRLLVILRCLFTVLRRGPIPIWGCAGTSATIHGLGGAVVVTDLPAVLLLGGIVATLARRRGLVWGAWVRVRAAVRVRPAGRLGGIGAIWLLGRRGAVVLRGCGLLLRVRVVVGRGFGVLGIIPTVSTRLGGTAGWETGVGLLFLRVCTRVVGLLLLPRGGVRGLRSTVIVAA